MTAQLFSPLGLPTALKKIPRHVAVIMDGNGRWASQHRLPRAEGHRRGAQALKKILRCCSDWGIEALTVYAFSTENWRRPQEEVKFLMGLFEQLLQRELDALCQEDIKVRFIGDLTILPNTLQNQVQRAMVLTAENFGVRLTVALNYGGRTEIVKACRHMVDLVRRGVLTPDMIHEESFGSALETAEVGDPDLLIRTSGEMRLSNFLLWQLAYTELYVTQTLWPDFDGESFKQALLDYQSRDRRYGSV